LGNPKALKIIDTVWCSPAPEESVRLNEIPGSEREIHCKPALPAMGFLYPQHEGLLEQSRVEYDKRGNIIATEKDYKTPSKKVFPAGDMH
jgi:glutamate synthase (NADPH/NADH) small chain